MQILWRVADIVGAPTYLIGLIYSIQDVKGLFMLAGGLLYIWARYRYYQAGTKIKEEEARKQKIENDIRQYDFDRKKLKDSSPGAPKKTA